MSSLLVVGPDVDRCDGLVAIGHHRLNPIPITGRVLTNPGICLMPLARRALFEWRRSGYWAVAGAGCAV